MRVAGITAIVLGLAVPAVQAADLSTREASRVQEAATVLLEIHGVPDKDIPQELWENAACVIVVPGLKKAAFIVGGEASIAAGHRSDATREPRPMCR